MSEDTIAAIATAPGRGGVGIIRVSGPEVPTLLAQVCGRKLTPRYAHYLPFKNAQGEAIDEGIALYFAAPDSFTGEEVLELQAHGGPVVLDQLLHSLLKQGVRLAEPGEFSKRAFLNNKLDLTQAEAIASLIESSSKRASKAALSSLQGAFSNEVNALVEALIQIRVQIEAGLDFDEEDIVLSEAKVVTKKLQDLQAALQSLLRAAEVGHRLQEGFKVVLVGKPNAGKSSLLNLLCKQEAAIVTDIPGTTRDLVQSQFNLDGFPVFVTDTAGLHDSDDPVEVEGMRRALQAVEDADHIVYVIDAAANDIDENSLEANLRKQYFPQASVTWVYNKADLSQGQITAHSSRIWLSTKTEAGLENLYQRLKNVMGIESESEHRLSARRRHIDLLEKANAFLTTSQQRDYLQQAELVAEDCREAQTALSEITGLVTSDDLLGRIFSEFCIGK